VGVTVLMKAALAGPLVSGLGIMRFPYPLTLTLMANVWTAVLIDLLMLLRKSWVRVVEARTLAPDAVAYAASSPGDSKQQDSPAATPPRSPPQQHRQQPSLREHATASQPKHDVVALVTMGVMQGLALGAKNEALLMLTVSTRTMIMATNVLVVMIIAGVSGLEKFGRTKILAALLVATGGVLQGLAHLDAVAAPSSSAGGHGGAGPAARSTDHPLGYVLAMVALVLDASRWVLLQRLFKRTEQEDKPGGLVGYMPPSMGSPSGDPRAEALLGEKDRFDACESGASTPARRCFRRAAGEPSAALSKLHMVSSVMWSATPVVLLLSLAFEPAAAPLALRYAGGLARLVLMLALGVMGINVCEFGVVQCTSAVTFVVLSNLHSIPMVLSGIVFFREQVSLLEVAGFTVCILGSLLYSRAKTSEAAATTK